MANITETVPFSFDDIYTSLETKFKDAGYDIVEGSNTAQLITAMTYLTSMLNVNTAVNINETLLPLASKRKNILQNSKVLGYEIAHKQSYKYKLTLSYTGDESGIVVRNIPKYSKFEADGNVYYYMGETKSVEVGINGAEEIIEVKEGTLYKYNEYPDNLSIITEEQIDEFGETVPQYYIDIPYTDVEEDGLEVFLTYYDYNQEKQTDELWKKSNNFLIDKDSVLDKEYIRLDDIDTGLPRIYFKMSGVGLGIGVGTEVNINVLQSSGTNGGIATDLNAIYNLPSGEQDFSGTFSHTLDGDPVISYVSVVLEGSDEETNESIKINAPMFHNSANRAVTRNDYTAISNRHSSVKKSMIWGGDDEFPKAPGHVWFSFLPSNVTNATRTFISNSINSEYNLFNPEDINLWFVQNDDIRSSDITSGIWDILDNYKILSLQFHNRHPIYLNFNFDIEVLRYLIKTSKADIRSDIFNIINNAFIGNGDTLELEDFDSEFFMSSINKRIDKYLSDSSGFNSSLTTQLMLTYNNISAEYVNKDFRDIYIPLYVPFEDYFDTDGALLTSVLPSIDTLGFIDNNNIYTDWDGISSPETDKTYEETSVIFAPIRMSASETVGTGVTDTIILTGIDAYPDDPSSVTETFANVEIYVDGALYTGTFSVTGVQDSGSGVWSYKQITLDTPLTGTENVIVNVKNHCGTYYIVNTFRKYIIAQLYVDGTNTVFSGVQSEPKSYLIINEDADTDLVDYIDASVDPDAIGVYLTVPNTANEGNGDIYLTTEGYIVLNDASNASEVSGTVVRKISPNLYRMTPLKVSHFGNVDETTNELTGSTPRYLDFNYISNNFRLMKNVIPRLKQVTFN